MQLRGELTAPHGESQGIPGLLTAGLGKSLVTGLTRALAPWLSAPLHRRKFPQTLRYADSIAYRAQTTPFIPSPHGRGLGTQEKVEQMKGTGWLWARPRGGWNRRGGGSCH